MPCHSVARDANLLFGVHGESVQGESGGAATEKKALTSQSATERASTSKVATKEPSTSDLATERASSGVLWFELAVEWPKSSSGSDNGGCVKQHIGSWTARCVAVNASDSVAGVETKRTLGVGAKDSVLYGVTEGEVGT
ncbi:hypothetical protein PPTG_13631 [Phytophthora nicotianae INRA-310]|uniref:Uncharacterized protein n=1 Tax=Phytophthora nicotianae (strain INRA-310) TaxID=761204 RepID=W2Q484_PHYN3|nr:hypothetical protein PPTG_13631 [Phytophthora nicotianae INRA-310]ETN07339.1 hypothetical protein PPTG_13631 [Phytophthora nicotianae INRA-310]